VKLARRGVLGRAAGASSDSSANPRSPTKYGDATARAGLLARRAWALSRFGAAFGTRFRAETCSRVYLERGERTLLVKDADGRGSGRAGSVFEWGRKKSPRAAGQIGRATPMRRRFDLVKGRQDYLEVRGKALRRSGGKRVGSSSNSRSRASPRGIRATD